MQRIGAKFKTKRCQSTQSDEQTRRAESRDGYNILAELEKTEDKRVSEYQTISECL